MLLNVSGTKFLPSGTSVLNYTCSLTRSALRPHVDFRTVIHAYAKSGGVAAATKAQHLLASMHKMYESGNVLAKPDTITVSFNSFGAFSFSSLLP